MEGKEIPSWEAFEQQVRDLRAELGRHATTLLFRGQSDSQWPLATTLERAGVEGMSFVDYYRLVTTGVGPAVETFSGVNVPEYSSDTAKSFGTLETFIYERFPDAPLYRYMIYLRHHGFPSPLLDWSQSPYVAAFFA